MYVIFHFFHSGFQCRRNRCFLQCLFTAVYLAISLVGCAPGPAAQSPDNTAIDRYFRQKTDSVYTSGVPFQRPVPLCEGQYVVYGIEWNGERSVLSLRVVKLQGDVVTLDVRSLTRRKETALTFKIKGLAEAIRSGDFDRVQIVETRYRDTRGLIRKTDTREVMWSSGMFTRLENLFNLPCTDSVRSETIEVRAGIFRNASSCVSINSLPGFISYMTVWKHPAVPLNGLVQWETRDGRLRARVLDFRAM